MTDAADQTQSAAATMPAEPLDLEAIERDLADVELALARLESGAYWTDEVTGEPLHAEWLAEHPMARRGPGGAAESPAQPAVDGV